MAISFSLGVFRHRVQLVEKSVGEDTHSLYEYRVNVPLQNFPEFSRTFNCSLGSKMNPRKKCTVWWYLFLYVNILIE